MSTLDAILASFGVERDWVRQAACRGADPAIFFPGRGESTREVKAICRGCPVRAECLTYAIQHGEWHGIWGGLSEHQRRKLRARYPVDGGERDAWAASTAG